MPMFSFRCRSCGHEFEDIVSYDRISEVKLADGKTLQTVVILPCEKCKDGFAEKVPGIEASQATTKLWQEQTWQEVPNNHDE